MSRRVLLIDADTDFRDNLSAQLSRYRIYVMTEADPDRAIALATSDPPELIVIAVEEPEKAGFRAFQKARKLLPPKLPILLVTETMAPDSFVKHRNLKVHADEYIDKRRVSSEELVGKIDNLIGLGEAADDDIAIPVDDDIPLEVAEGDVVLDEQVEAEDDPAADFDEHAAQTVGPNSGVTVDQMVAAETDAAFDALMGDEPKPRSALPGVAEYRHERVTPVVDETEAEASAIPEPVPHKIRDEDSDSVVDGVPAAAEVDLDSVPTPINDSKRVDDRSRADSEFASEEPVHVAPEPGAMQAGHEAARDSLSAIPLVDDDLVALDEDSLEEVDDEPAKEPSGAVPQPIAAAGPEREVTPTHVVRDPVIPDSARKSAQHAAVDLGLDKLAKDAETEQSGVYDRKSLRKIGELERQIAQLKTELDRARTAADATAAEKGSGRESQFLKLREERLAKDTELKQVKSKLDQQSKELAAATEKLRQAVEAKTALDAKTDELETEVTELRTKAKELAASLKDATAQASHLEQELEAKTKTASTTEKTLAQAEKDLAGERASRAASASDSERTLRLERDSMLARHKGEMAALRAETEAATELALVRVREELEVEKQQAVRDAVEETRRMATQDRTDALAEVETKHNAKLVEFRKQQADEVSAIKNELDAEIGRLREALAEVQADKVAALAAAEGTLAEELENLRAQHAVEIEARHEEHAEARARDATSHGQALAQLKQQLDRTVQSHETAIAKLADTHEGEIAELATAHRTEVAELRGRNDHEIAQLTDATKRQIETHRAELADEQAKRDSLLAAANDTAEREIGEQRALLEAARQDLEDAKAQLAAQREELEQQHASALGELAATHERALAVASGELQRATAAADAEHKQAIAGLKAEADRMLRRLEDERAQALRDLETERDDLVRGLSGARDSLNRSQNELASAVQTIADRNHEVRAQTQAITERDQRIAQLRGELEAIEQENASYQEQVLRAYQKIKSDEAMVARARKAMAIALTVLDDQGNPTT